MDLPKAYEAKDYEDMIYSAWEQSGFFNPDQLSGDPYTIMMPPPNVTGVLHLGHALENTLMDTMARFQRMQGKRVLLVPGTDHAAIATQAKVEKLLIEQGIANPRQTLGREQLLQKIRVYAEESKTVILRQIRKMGTSCDWSRLAYTFDEVRNQAVNALFVRLYEDGLIYRGHRVVNWSIKGQSTCSDDEIIYKERETTLYTFRYAKDFPIAISTTRPETKLGDTAVAVHPADERYAHYIGQTFQVDVGAAAILSLRVIADEQVDPSFGTGALGVTPAHSSMDFTMYEKQKAHGTPIGLVQVIGLDGTMTTEAGTAYVGLSVEQARAKFVAWLSTQGLLEAEEVIVQNVGTSDRFGDVIEALPMTQWWLDLHKQIPGRGKSLRDLMREAVTTGLDGDPSKRVTLTPVRFTKLYLDRVANLRDWCLSRQLWWGHRIPVWYRQEDMFVGPEAPEGEGWEQDPDTLDTWFSSGSWTFSTLGWPQATTDLQMYHPTQWMQMGYEILYLWLMRMILMSAYALEQIPFTDVYIHGILRDQHGKKFSKSSGNGIDPLDVIDQYGCDALRISLLIGISPGNDSRYFTEKIESGRNFINKLWNIGRFIFSRDPVVSSAISVDTSLADRWIRSRLASVTEEVTRHLTNGEFSQAGEKLRDFTWSEFADWYLEATKVTPTPILPALFDHVLKLWHPFMPFVTEVLWKMQHDSLLMVESWPNTHPFVRDEKAEQQFTFLQEVITAIRNVRAEHQIAPKRFVPLFLIADAMTRLLLEAHTSLIQSLGRVSSLTFVDAEPEGSLATIAGSVRLFVPSGEIVDVQSQNVRLEKELAELDTYLVSLAQKLRNQEFLSKAPEHVVASMQEKQAEALQKRDALRAQLS